MTNLDGDSAVSNAFHVVGLEHDAVDLYGIRLILRYGTRNSPLDEEPARTPQSCR